MRAKLENIEKIVKEQNLLEGTVMGSDGEVKDAVFSDSELTDVNEFIDEGLSEDEIIEEIKQWHPL